METLRFLGGPIALILIASVGDQTLWFSFTQTGFLMVLGTAWIGTTCLVNALRCGRVHCWVDGLLLPALAVVGILNLFGIIALPWSGFRNSYVSVFWLILLVSLVVEVKLGMYFGSGASKRSR